MACVEPKVSVVMPVYNTGQPLIVAVTSVLRQTYTNLELLIVDDGSSEPTRSICEQLAATESRVKVIRKTNGGVSSAINMGMLYASGKYFIIVASDDELDEGMLAAIMPHLVETGADVGCFGMAFTYQVKGREVRRIEYVVDEYSTVTNSEDLSPRFRELFERNYLSSVCNKIFKREFVLANNLVFNTSMAVLEDLDFVLRLLLCEPSLVILPEVFYNYKHNVGESSHARRPDIDYVENFAFLERSLVALASMLEMNSSKEREYLASMVFRFYLIGLEIPFSRRISRRKRSAAIRKYALDRRVFEAARDVASGPRGVVAMARLVTRRRVNVVYWLLWGHEMVLRVRRRLLVAYHSLRDVGW